MGRLGTRSTPWRSVKLEISPVPVETRFLNVLVLKSEVKSVHLNGSETFEEQKLAYIAL